MQPINKEFIKNTAILFIGRMCTKIIQFLLLPLYTAVLTTSEYGTVDLISTCVTILVVLVNLQIENAIFRFLIENRGQEKEIKIVISNVVFISTFQLIIYAILYLLFQNLITIDSKIFLLLNVISSIFVSGMLQVTRGLGDYKTYAKASFFSAASIIIFNIIFLLVCKMSVAGLLLSTFISNILTGLYLIFKKKIYKYINHKYIDKKQQKEYLKYSIPLIPNELSWQAIKSSDKIIVSAILGIEANGILSLSTKFSNIYTEIYNIFNTSLTDTIVVNLNKKDGKNYIIKIINELYRLFLSLALLMISIMPFIFNFFINDNFAESYNYIPLYILACIFNVLVGLISGIFVANKNTKLIATTSTLAGILNIIIDLLLMKIIGLYAAVLSTIIGFLTMFIIRYRIIVKQYDIRIKMSNFLITIVMFMLLLPAYYTKNTLINMVALLITIILAIGLNKKTLQTCFEYIKDFLNIKRRKNNKRCIGSDDTI